MLISIIVPVYNCENTICRCIDSLLSQTFSSIEVLLIDDSSTDSSGRLCDKYGESDSRVHVLHNLTQGGG
ncbi:glycosyltransferase family 2 protein [Parabacteroides distasonis]|nr:glycosyltransferase family 2 protein [Parabacteroides distasonis]MDB9131748.1 glycosyltransferase family 2 protein [Parabacteroides distasonis]